MLITHKTLIFIILPIFYKNTLYIKQRYYIRNSTICISIIVFLFAVDKILHDVAKKRINTQPSAVECDTLTEIYIKTIL